VKDDAKEAGKKKTSAATTATPSSAQPSAAADGDAEMADAEPSTSELEEAVRKHAGQPTGQLAGSHPACESDALQSCASCAAHVRPLDLSMLSSARFALIIHIWALLTHWLSSVPWEAESKHRICGDRTCKPLGIAVAREGFAAMAAGLLAHSSPRSEQPHLRAGKYELMAVLTHKGRSADSGHYVAWVKQDDKQWIQFDDEELIPRKEVRGGLALRLGAGSESPWRMFEAYLSTHGANILRLPCLRSRSQSCRTCSGAHIAPFAHQLLTAFRSGNGGCPYAFRCWSGS
jgi:hypothetical protein